MSAPPAHNVDRTRVARMAFRLGLSVHGLSMIRLNGTRQIVAHNIVPVAVIVPLKWLNFLP